MVSVVSFVFVCESDIFVEKQNPATNHARVFHCDQFMLIRWRESTGTAPPLPVAKHNNSQEWWPCALRATCHYATITSQARRKLLPTCRGLLCSRYSGENTSHSPQL